MKKPLLLVAGIVLLVFAPFLVLTSNVAAWMLPETYAGRAKIVLSGASNTTLTTEIHRITSSEVLNTVIRNLTFARNGAGNSRPRGL